MNFTVSPNSEDSRRYYAALCLLTRAKTTTPPHDLCWEDFATLASRVPGFVRFTEHGELVTTNRATANALADHLFALGLHATITAR